MFAWFTRWWHARQRKIDREILWPVCKQHACGMEHARAAFMLHAANDEAYSDLTDDDLVRYIGDLK